MSKICAHCTISGKVQGVFFRAGTKEKARELGITGWVKNTLDGKVEALICGDKDKVEKMHLWLEGGPQRARVDEIKIEYLEYETHGKQFTEFQIV